ncbi:MAG: zinc ribbon domain-containing protein [Anaerolineae bacterium]
MMFGGGMFLISLLVLAVIAVPVIILIVAASGGLALFNNRPALTQSHSPGPHTPAFSSKLCPNCGQPLQADWRVCPYDGTEVG